MFGGAPPPCATSPNRPCDGYCGAVVTGHFGERLALNAVAALMWNHGTEGPVQVYRHCVTPYRPNEGPDDAPPEP